MSPDVTDAEHRRQQRRDQEGRYTPYSATVPRALLEAAIDGWLHTGGLAAPHSHCPIARCGFEPRPPCPCADCGAEQANCDDNPCSFGDYCNRERARECAVAALVQRCGEGD